MRNGLRLAMMALGVVSVMALTPAANAVVTCDLHGTWGPEAQAFVMDSNGSIYLQLTNNRSKLASIACIVQGPKGANGHYCAQLPQTNQWVQFSLMDNGQYALRTYIERQLNQTLTCVK